MGPLKEMICHVLLIETEQGLVLVDSGLGMADIAEADKRLGMHTLKTIRPRLNPNETALRQLQKLGFTARDVTHIILTHLRYRPIQWSHGPDWEIHKVSVGERWFDLECVKELKGLPPEILVVPLTGHTLGHCGVAIKQPEGWLLHAGDAYFYHGQLDPHKPRCPVGLRWFQTMMQVDGETRLHNLAKLREIAGNHADQVKIFCSHDPVEFSRFAPQNKAV